MTSGRNQAVTQGGRVRAFVTGAMAFTMVLGLAACSGGGGGSGDPEPPGSGGGDLPDEPVIPGPGPGASPDTWVIGPENDFDPAALQQTFMLENEGTGPLDWNVQLSAPWLQISGPATGTLAAGASVGVTVDADPYGADATGSDLPTAQVVFKNTATGDTLSHFDVVIDSSFSMDSTFAAGGNNGWTALTPSPDSKAVYVSSSGGNDANDGLSHATAKRTIAAAKTLLTHGKPDWLLLKRGDTWNEGLGHWNKSGRSPAEPMVVAWYGTAVNRPLLQTGSGNGIWTSGAGGAPATVENVAIVGLHFKANGYNGSGSCSGASILHPTKHMLFEDCMFEAYNTNLVLQGYGGRHEDLRVRRCVIVDAYGVHGQSTHPQGLYAWMVDGLLLEENLFDHNGWSSSVPNAGPDIFSHNVYVDNDCTEVVVRGNIITNPSSHGMQLRPGGTAINNLFVQNSIALAVGGGNDPDPGGVLGNVLGNVVLEGKNIDSNNPRGWALWFANIAQGRVAYNVVANNSQGSLPFALTIVGDHDGDTYPSIGVHNLFIDHNVFRNWGGNLRIEGQPWQVTNIDLAVLDVQDLTHATPLIDHPQAGNTVNVQSGYNRFFSALTPSSGWSQLAQTNHTIDYWKTQVGDTTSTDGPVTYINPAASVGGYNGTLGGSTSLAAFLTEARKQSYVNWRPEYMAVRVNRYVRDSFRE
jgi:hypothetical protein